MSTRSCLTSNLAKSRLVSRDDKNKNLPNKEFFNKKFIILKETNSKYLF